MTNAVTEARRILKAAIETADLKAHATKPERVATPCVFIGPDDPYLQTDGAAFSSELLNLEVVVVAAAGVNEHRAEELDALILHAFDAAVTVGFRVREVQRPGSISLAGQSHVAAVINVQTEIHRD